MRLYLTDKQIVFLDWDLKPSLKTYSDKQGGGADYELDDHDLEEIRDVAETAAWGSDPSIMASAKGLLRKLEKLGK